MSHARIWSAITMVMATTLIGCGEDPANRIAGSAAADYKGRAPMLDGGCNGVDGSQLKISSMGDLPQRLEQVVVYGNPVSRSNRGYGDLSSYGAVTNVFIYDRDALDQCSFGAENTFSMIGPVADDTLDAPIEAPDGIPQDIWNELTPRVKKQLREAAWYLAEHWIPNDLPGIGDVIRETRRGMIFAALAKGYFAAQDQRVDRRRATEMFERSNRGNARGLSENELLRVDALTLGCMTVQSFRALRSWNAQQAEEWASRVTSAWASDATQDYTRRYLEPQLARLAAIGAQMGREGDTCSEAARYHFENRTSELYDPSQGDGGNPFLF